MKILVTGGAGFIGGVTQYLLAEAGHEVVVFDNLSCNGNTHNIHHKAHFIDGDIRSRKDLERAFEYSDYDCIIHFAAKLSVPESVEDPFLYFDNNVRGSTRLAEVALKHGVRNIIFSSTCSMYQSQDEPVDENVPIAPLNPYAHSKRMVEQMLEALGQAKKLNWLSLRYFNAAGAYRHIGPVYRTKTALFVRLMDMVANDKPLQVYGSDYDTRDGTAIRDYIHVKDLAKAHVLAAEKIGEGKKFKTYINLGTGTGSTVLEVIKAFEAAIERPVKHEIVDRRKGDPQTVYADPAKAKELLGWEAKKSLEKMVKDAWRWKQKYDYQPTAIEE